MGEAEDVAVAIFQFEFFHLVEGHFQLAGNFGALRFESAIEAVNLAAVYVRVPSKVGDGPCGLGECGPSGFAPRPSGPCQSIR
jgi:hypothetical protein